MSRCLADLAIDEEANEKLGGEGDETQDSVEEGEVQDGESIVATTAVADSQPSTFQDFSQPLNPDQSQDLAEEAAEQEEDCFLATRAVATQQPVPFQPSFPQPPSSSANLLGSATFAPFNVVQSTTGTQQPRRSASLPRQPQAQAKRGNSHAAAHQLALIAEEKERPDEGNLMLESE